MSTATTGTAELLMRAARHLQIIKNRNLEFYATGPTQRKVLLIIMANPGLTQAQLTRLMKVDKSTVCKLVRKLKQVELITQRPSQSDRRTRVLRATFGAKAFTKVFAEEPADLDTIVTYDLTADETEQLDKLLRRASACIKHVLDLPPDAEFPPCPYRVGLFPNERAP